MRFKLRIQLLDKQLVLCNASVKCIAKCIDIVLFKIIVNIINKLNAHTDKKCSLKDGNFDMTSILSNLMQHGMSIV